MGTYNKTHLWAGERFWFRAGDRYPVFHMDFGTVGLMICYDGGFPEVSRILALSGAELILAPVRSLSVIRICGTPISAPAP